jgi:hypothetical protein
LVAFNAGILYGVHIDTFLVPNWSFFKLLDLSLIRPQIIDNCHYRDKNILVSNSLAVEWPAFDRMSVQNITKCLFKIKKAEV